MAIQSEVDYDDNVTIGKELEILSSSRALISDLA